MNPTQIEEKLNEALQFLMESNYSKALSAYAKLAQQNPRNAWIWFHYGSAAGAAGQVDLLERLWRTALELEPNNSGLLLQMGHQYQSLRMPLKARVSFERAVALDPRGINPHMGLAIFLEKNHQFGEAREAVAACLTIDPRDDQARYFMALLNRRENKFEAAEQELRDLIASEPRHPFVMYASRYELAEVLNRTERFDEAMDMLAEAKKLVCNVADVDSMLKLYDKVAEKNRCTTQALPANILGIWSREFPKKKREEIPNLAFLGGHPRSGTTLLEQILGAHPEVAALDEPVSFDRIMHLYNTSQQLTPARLNFLRRRYIADIKTEVDDNGKASLILDKNPSPTTRLSVWLRIFPELRVIIALRDPRDVVISCYFQNIPLNPINANFLSLERIAIHYSNLMSVWLAVRKWEGFAWMETHYEDTVADLAKEGRRVTEFLGLTWHDAQARYHELSNKKQMFSPTYHDASQPVYARSVSRWRAFEKHLGPIQPLLEPYCKAFGYS